MPLKKDIINYLFFSVGVGMLVMGILQRNYILLIIGAVIIVFSLYVLVLKKKGIKKDIFSLKKPGTDEEKEEDIIKQVDKLLKKEKELKEKEKILANNIEGIYKKALELKGKEMELKGKEKEIIKKEKELPKREKELTKSKIIKEKGSSIDEDTRKVLKITDNLLEKLPDDEIDKFAKSKDFELYKKVMEKIK